MTLSILYAIFFSCAMASMDHSSGRTLQKRDEDGTFSCYDAGNIIDFSALCPSSNYPIRNDRGLSMIGTLYFALASTTLPDNTTYNARENIICTINGPTQNITATISAGAGGDIVNAGASVSFDLSLPNFSDDSLCMFTEGTTDDTKNVTVPITLAQARNLTYTMLTTPDYDCETCGRIPIRYPQVMDGSGQGGGILKIDVRKDNQCIGKCIGPNSFSIATPSPTPTPSEAAAIQIKPFGASPGRLCLMLATAACLLGVGVFGSLL